MQAFFVKFSCWSNLFDEFLQDSLSEGNQRGPEVTPTPDGAVAFAASVEQSRQEVLVSRSGVYVVQTLRF